MRVAVWAMAGSLAAVLLVGTEARAEGPAGGTKVCLLGIGHGMNAAAYRVDWQSVTPVPDSWTWQDCQNMGRTAAFDEVALGCIYAATDALGRRLEANFTIGKFWSTSGLPTHAQVGEEALPTPSAGRNCGW